MRLAGKTAILALAAVITAAAHAQAPLSPDTVGSTSGPQNEIGGTPTIDVIAIKDGVLGVPLRYGGILLGSERVEFNGRTLQRGTDYSIDLMAGVVYLMHSVKTGDVVRVAYRYDNAKVAQAKQRSQFAGVAPFRLNVSPGSSLLVGFGMTERQADGNVVQSNMFGWNNRMNFGSIRTNGLMLLGDRQRVETKSDFEFRKEGGKTETGKSHFAVQNLVMGLGGASEIEVNYQDISKNFAGFGAAQDSGFTAAQIQQLQKERGLERFQIGAKDINLGGLKFSGNHKSVENEGEDITWQSYGMSAGGFSVNWKSQKVGDKFARFQDLAEGDREQLRKEAGMERETLSGSFANKASKLNFSVNQIADPNSAKIERREVNFETGKFKFWAGDQEVEKDFRRMGSLLGNEQAMFGRELGMERQWFGMQATLFGAGTPITFNQMSLGNERGEYQANNLRIEGKGWSLEHIERNAETGFNAFGAMQDAERNEHINAVGKMYEPNGVAFRGEEVPWFQRSAGLNRSVSRILASPAKDWNVRFDHLKIDGRQDGATVNTLGIDGKKFKFNFRKQELGEQFGELGQLMELERNRLGMISGLERTDFNVSVDLSPNRSFLYAKMQADAPNGGASRETFNYKDPRLNVSVATREVDPGFNNVHQLIDPEREFLATLRGFKERDVKATWTLMPNLNLDVYMLDAASASLDQNRYIHNYALNWKVDKNTTLTARRFEQSNDDPINVLFANKVDFLNFNRSFGKYGNLTYLSERKEYDGLETNLSDSEREYLGYEAKLDPKTSLKAEASRTRFDDGKKEDVNTSTVSTELNKRMGVSVSNVQIDREGEDRDEKRRNYGFWFDIGNGIRLIYGYAQHKAGETVLDTQNQNAQITGGTIGNVQLGNAVYQENQWENGRTQATGNVSMSTVKPMSFLGITDLKIKASLDTASDRKTWLRENQNYGFSGKLGANGIGYEYRSQIAANGMRGVDRSAFFTTDQDEKKPLRLSLRYKQRNLPTGDEIHIRDYAIIAKPSKNIELTHNLLTHPEVARGDVILGSITTARRENRWKLDVKQGPNLTIGGEWRELFDQNLPMTRVGGLNVTFNKAIGSPLSFYYGVEESDARGKRQRFDRYHVRFDQRPGPNQQFSFFIGNVSYVRGLQDTMKRNNLTVQLDYQIRF